jgi:hypothetical protein
MCPPAAVVAVESGREAVEVTMTFVILKLPARRLRTSSALDRRHSPTLRTRRQPCSGTRRRPEEAEGPCPS